MCEYIRPYDTLAKEVMEVIKNTSARVVVFVEEEIKAGGFGMMLAEKLRVLGAWSDIKYDIAAPDDNFVIQSVNEHIYKSAGIDTDALVDKALGLCK